MSPHPDGLCIDAYNKNRHHTSSIVTKQGKGLCFSMQPSYTMTFQARMACNFFVHTKFVFFLTLHFFPVSCIKVGACRKIISSVYFNFNILSHCTDVFIHVCKISTYIFSCFKLDLEQVYGCS